MGRRYWVRRLLLTTFRAAVVIAVAIIGSSIHDANSATNLSPPSISSTAPGTFGGPLPGYPAVGDVLFTDNGEWSGSPTGFTYAWNDCDSNGANCVAAAGSPTNTQRYQIVSGDTGSTIRVAVTASYSGQPSATVMSQPTGVIGGPLFLGADEFNNSSINTSNWTPVDNTIGNTNTFQCDQAAQDTETGGYLTTALQTGSFSCPGPTGGNGGITSCPGGACPTTLAGGEVHWRDFAFQYGTITVNAKMFGQASITNGAWPAIWMLGYNCQHPAYLVAGNDPSPCDWPTAGSEEFDIGEVKDYTGSKDAQVWNNQITSSGTQSCTPSAGSGLPGGFSASGAFHTYQLAWSSGAATFSVDGTQTCQFTSNVPADPMFLILSGTQMESTTVPSSTTSQFDYVHVTPSGPLPTVAPSISGSLAHGSSLTAANGTWSGSPTFQYQWMTCNGSGLVCSYITSGSSCSTTPFTCASSYTTTSGEEGDDIQLLVQATDGSGVVQVGSTPVGPVT